MDRSLRRRAGPGCPDCGTWIPFGKSQWRIGTPFACRNCGGRLELSRVRSTLMELAMLTAYWLARPSLDGFAQHAMAIAAIVLIGTPVSYLLSRPARAAPPPATGSDAA